MSKLLDGLTSIFSSGASKLVDSTFKGLDSLITTKEEKGEQTIRLEEIKSAREKGQLDFELASKRLEIELANQEYNDRASARDMQAKTKSKIPGVLAMFFTGVYLIETIGFIVMIFLMLGQDLPQYAVMFISSLWGATSAIEVQIISFYFGSSKGTEDQVERTTVVANRTARQHSDNISG